MKVNELNRDQKIQLKQAYLYDLADRGIFARVMDVDYNDPSYLDLARADDLVSDYVINEKYKGVEFTEEDFFMSEEVSDGR